MLFFDLFWWIHEDITLDIYIDFDKINFCKFVLCIKKSIILDDNFKY